MTDLNRRDFLSLSGGAIALGSFGLASGRAALVQAASTPDALPRRTLVRGADVLTMDPAVGELRDVDVLVDEGRVAAIGRGLEAADALVIDARRMILMPGLADGHRHVWQAAEAGRLVKTNPQRFSSEYQHWKMRWMPCATPDDHYLAALFGGLQAVDSGVTALIDHAHGQHTADRALASARGLLESGVAGWFAYQVSHSIDYGPGDTLPLAEATRQRQAFTTAEHWETVDRLREEVLREPAGRLRTGIALSVGSKGQALSRVREEEFQRAREREIGLITQHVHDSAPGIPEGHFGHRGTGIPDLYEAGLLGPDCHGSHGVTLDQEELRMMAETGMMLSVTAMAETFPSRPLARRDPAVARGRAAGVATGIGIDTPLSLNQDYFEHIRASFLSQYLDEESENLAREWSSLDALDVATRAGYASIGLGDVGGRVEEGLRADLVLLDTSRPGFATAGSLADRVVNFATLTDVDSVWVEGRLLKSGGRMIGVDWRRLKEDIVAMQERIAAEMATITFA
jgi:cytosine/adenosine deaminase-related metal-dependent hydrolase